MEKPCLSSISESVSRIPPSSSPMATKELANGWLVSENAFERVTSMASTYCDRKRCKTARSGDPLASTDGHLEAGYKSLMFHPASLLCVSQVLMLEDDVHWVKYQTHTIGCSKHSSAGSRSGRVSHEKLG